MGNTSQAYDALENFAERIPFRTHCSDTKQLEFFLPRIYAQEYPYIRMNFPHIDYLCFDLDYASAPIAARECNMPEPTLTMITRDSNHAHLLYELLYPIPKTHSKATRALLKDVIYGYKEVLCADKVITTQRQLIKNALSDTWAVIKGIERYSLAELAESIPAGFSLDKTYQPPERLTLAEKPFSETLNPDSRNVSLFNAARFYAYSIAREHATYDLFYGAILERVIHLNNKEIPKYFPVKIRQTSELHSIARSISRWVFARRNQFKCVNHGAMGFESMKGTYWEPNDYEREVKRRRILSAERTANIKRESTETKIRSAVKLCFKRGIKPTMANIATLAQIHRRTAYNHKELIAKCVHFGLSGK